MYEGMLDGMVIDCSDSEQVARISALGMRVLVTDAVMANGTGRKRLAREVLRFCSGLKTR
jgi:LPPG:FO 2-phospho-L-lactate transferase